MDTEGKQIHTDLACRWNVPPIEMIYPDTGIIIYNMIERKRAMWPHTEQRGRKAQGLPTTRQGASLDVPRFVFNG